MDPKKQMLTSETSQKNNSKRDRILSVFKWEQTKVLTNPE